jgi:signal transduction histidine kinase/ActR/RegA family two-component response regulator
MAVSPPAAAPENPDPPRRRVHPAVTVAVTLALMLAATVALSLWHMRRDSLESQHQAMASLASASADELERSVQGVVLALQSTRLDVEAGHPDTAEQLERHAALLPLVQQIWIVDARGVVLAASGQEMPPPMAGYLPAPLGLDSDGVSFSLPFVAPGAGGPSIALAMRWQRADGFSGWVLATMPAVSLLGAFPRAALSPDTRLVVLRSDGAVLAGTLRLRPQPREPRATGQAAPDDPLQPFDDGSRRLLQQRRIEPLGLSLWMTRDLDVALARWREVRQMAVAGLAAALLGLALLLWRLLRAEAHSRRLQEQLGRARKLESLGTLAGGVAHDFNNILAAVLGFGEMARGAAPEGSAQARQLDQVIQAALRGKGVIDRILAFSRSGVRPSADFLAQPVVEQVLGLLAATLPEGVQIEPRLLAPQGRLRGDATAWFEAVMNLCTNALQAMAGGGGVLGVGLQAETLPADRPTTHGMARAGEHLVLQVSDTGTGMAPEVLDRLFDPFFTTRGQQGTGLGLAVVHGVVEALGGAVDVHSHPGTGSRFTLYLPVAAGLTEGADPAPSVLPAEAPHGQGQTLLVVDDEAPLVALAEELLAELGYEPVGFTDPHQALAALAADPARFDLLLTDEVMPGLTGTALAAQALALRPGLPVLLLSGYGGPQLAARAAEAGVKQVLAKPLERSELARAVAAALPGPDDN